MPGRDGGQSEVVLSPKAWSGKAVFKESLCLQGSQRNLSARRLTWIHFAPLQKSSGFQASHQLCLTTINMAILFLCRVSSEATLIVRPVGPHSEKQRDGNDLHNSRESGCGQVTAIWIEAEEGFDDSHKRFQHSVAPLADPDPTSDSGAWRKGTTPQAAGGARAPARTPTDTFDEQLTPGWSFLAGLSACRLCLPRIRSSWHACFCLLRCLGSSRFGCHYKFQKTRSTTGSSGDVLHLQLKSELCRPCGSKHSPHRLPSRCAGRIMLLFAAVLAHSHTASRASS